MKDIVNMAKRPSDGGGSTAFNQDRKLLMDLMTQFYFLKSLWRSDADLITLPTAVNIWAKKQEVLAGRHNLLLKSSSTKKSLTVQKTNTRLVHLGSYGTLVGASM